LVTELAERGELTHLIRELGKYNPLIHLDSALRTKEVLQFIVSEILGALEYMHSVGVSHRDLKPENIFVNEKGFLKIGDLGSAGVSESARKKLNIKNYKHKDGEKEEGKLDTFVGTTEYVSPEILKGRSCSPAADMWSLGVIIYQLYTGRTPFNEPDSQYFTFQNIMECKYDIPEGIPEEGKELISKLLKVDPKTRLTVRQVKQHPFFEDYTFDKFVGHQSPLCELYTKIKEKEIDLVSSEISSFVDGENFDEDFSEGPLSNKNIYLNKSKASPASPSNCGYMSYIKKSSSLGERDLRDLHVITEKEEEECKKEESMKYQSRKTVNSNNTDCSKDNSQEITYDSIVEPSTPTLRVPSPDPKGALVKDISFSKKVVTMEGHIKKITAWIIYKRRYMELSYNGGLPRLVYFTANKKSLRNEIPLTKKTKAYITGNNKFEIVDLGHTYYFKDCGGEAKIKQWVAAITDAVDTLNCRKTSLKGNKALSATFC